MKKKNQETNVQIDPRKKQKKNQSKSRNLRFSFIPTVNNDEHHDQARCVSHMFKTKQHET